MTGTWKHCVSQCDQPELPGDCCLRTKKRGKTSAGCRNVVSCCSITAILVRNPDSRPLPPARIYGKNDNNHYIIFCNNFFFCYYFCYYYRRKEGRGDSCITNARTAGTTRRKLETSDGCNEMQIVVVEYNVRLFCLLLLRCIYYLLEGSYIGPCFWREAKGLKNIIT